MSTKITKVNKQGLFETHFDRLLIQEIVVADYIIIKCIDVDSEVTDFIFLLTDDEGLADFCLKANLQAARIVRYMERKPNADTEAFTMDMYKINFGWLPITNLSIRVAEPKDQKMTEGPMFYAIDEVMSKPVSDTDSFEYYKTLMFHRERYLIDRYSSYLEFLEIYGARKSRIKVSLESDELFAIARLIYEIFILESGLPHQENRNDRGGYGEHDFREEDEDDIDEED